MLETNVDDLSPQIVAYALEQPEPGDRLTRGRRRDDEEGKDGLDPVRALGPRARGHAVRERPARYAPRAGSRATEPRGVAPVSPPRFLPLPSARTLDPGRPRAGKAIAFPSTGRSCRCRRRERGARSTRSTSRWPASAERRSSRTPSTECGARANDQDAAQGGGAPFRRASTKTRRGESFSRRKALSFRDAACAARGTRRRGGHRRARKWCPARFRLWHAWRDDGGDAKGYTQRQSDLCIAPVFPRTKPARSSAAESRPETLEQLRGLHRVRHVPAALRDLLDVHLVAVELVFEPVHVLHRDDAKARLRSTRCSRTHSGLDSRAAWQRLRNSRTAVAALVARRELNADLRQPWRVASLRPGRLGARDRLRACNGERTRTRRTSATCERVDSVTTPTTVVVLGALAQPEEDKHVVTDGDRRVALTAVLRVVHSRLGPRGGGMAPCASATGQAVVVPPPVAQDCRSGCGTSRARCGPAGPRERLLGHCRGRSRRGRGASRRVSRPSRPIAGAAIVPFSGSDPPARIACRRLRCVSDRTRAATGARGGARRGSRAAERTRADILVEARRPRAGHHRRGRGRGRERRGRRRERRDRSRTDAPDAGGETEATGGAPARRPPRRLARRLHERQRFRETARVRLHARGGAHYRHGKNTRMGVTRDSTVLPRPRTRSIRAWGTFSRRSPPARRSPWRRRARLAESLGSCLAESRATHALTCADDAGRRPRGRGAARRAQPLRCSRGPEASQCPRRRRRRLRARVLGQRVRTAPSAARSRRFAKGGTRARRTESGNRSERGAALRAAELGGDGDGDGDGDAPRTPRTPRTPAVHTMARISHAFYRRARPFDDAARKRTSSRAVDRDRRALVSGTTRRLGVAAAVLRRRPDGRALRPDRRPLRPSTAVAAGNRRENKKMNSDTSRSAFRGAARGRTRIQAEWPKGGRARDRTRRALFRPRASCACLVSESNAGDGVPAPRRASRGSAASRPATARGRHFWTTARASRGGARRAATRHPPRFPGASRRGRRSRKRRTENSTARGWRARRAANRRRRERAKNRERAE